MSERRKRETMKRLGAPTCGTCGQLSRMRECDSCRLTRQQRERAGADKEHSRASYLARRDAEAWNRPSTPAYREACEEFSDDLEFAEGALQVGNGIVGPRYE